MNPDDTHEVALPPASDQRPEELAADKTGTESAATYAIGDVHGMGTLLRKLLREIEADARNRKAKPRVIFLGDLFDHGHSSDLVFELVDECVAKWEGSKLLIGNHDQFFVEAAEGRMTSERWSAWFEQGGDVTMSAISVTLLRGSEWAAVYFSECEPGYLELMKKALPYHVEDDYCFVHAGLRPGVAIESQSLHDLVWIRDEFLRSSFDFGKIVVHGHSITPSFLPEVHSNRIAVDTGACHHGGRLTALVISNGVAANFISVSNSGVEVRSLDECRVDEAASQRSRARAHGG